MNDRSKTISRLCSDLASRASYIKAKLGVLVPSQIKALRLTSNMPRQSDLAREVDMQQSRISMFETPGAANMTLETLSRLAAAFKVGLVVEFVSFSDMLEWENNFSQDSFDVLRIDEDKDFIRGARRSVRTKRRRNVGIGRVAIPAQVPSAEYASAGHTNRAEKLIVGLPIGPIGIPSIRPLESKQQAVPTSDFIEATAGGMPHGRAEENYPAA